MRSLALALLLAGCGLSDEDIARNLKSPNPVVREDTAKIAKNYGSDAVNKSLIAALDDPSPVVRKNAVDSLASLEAKEAAPRLAELLGSETDPDTLREIVDALGRLQDPNTAPALIDWLTARESDPPLNAIWALGNIGDPRSLELLSRLRNSSDPIVAYNATAALRLLHP